MAKPLKIVAIDEADRYVVKISGEIIEANCQQIADVIKHLLVKPKSVVVDLSQVWLMDAAGLRVFMRAQTWLADHGKTLILRRPAERVRRVFVATSLEPMLSD